MIQSTRPTIFVIDDDTSVQRALARLLNSANYNVITFTSVDLFLELSEWPTVASVVADIRMPGTQSMLLPKLLSERNLHYPVIFLTAQDTEVNRDAASSAGAAAFFRKPVDDQALIDAINWSLHDATSSSSSSHVK